MGPVGVGVLVVSAGAVFATRNTPSRSVRRLTWYVAGTAAVSLLVRWGAHQAASRASPLMLLDAAGLYVMALIAVCRWQWAPWLYGLIAATALECVSHLAYVGEVISGDLHTLSLNLLFLAQLCCLVLGRRAPPDVDLKEPFPSEALV